VFNIGPQELLLILLVALVVVGPKRLPELSRTIGRGLREFRKAQDEVKKTINLSLDESEPTTPARPAAARSGDTVATPAPVAEPAAGSGPDAAADVARTLGRGLAEIRQARREIQRTFRVDMSDEPPRRPSAPTPPATKPAATTPDAKDAPAGPETPA
jgi:Tat protein translocase TatB subunit